jgi:hypothetical protein
MQHGGDYHGLFCLDDFVDYPVGKSVGITPSDILAGMSAALEQGVLCQRIEHADNFLPELVSQSGLMRIIPSGGLTHVGLNFWAEQDAPTHDGD